MAKFELPCTLRPRHPSAPATAHPAQWQCDVTAPQPAIPQISATDGRTSTRHEVQPPLSHHPAGLDHRSVWQHSDLANALKNVPQKRRPWVILREVLIAFALLLLFMFIGDGFLRVMNLSPLSLQIAGGVILFLIALRMIFPPPEPLNAAESQQAPLIVPLAIPALAGPSALATVLLLVSQAPERRWEWIAALSVTMLVCALVLAERIQRVLGERFIIAVERLMGLILGAVAVEMLLRGFKTFSGH